MASQPPIHTPLVDPKSPNTVPSIWARFWGNLLAIGNPGIGNGTNGNVQAPAIGTGTGPANPHLVVAFRQVTINKETFWLPLFQ